MSSFDLTKGSPLIQRCASDIPLDLAPTGRGTPSCESRARESFFNWTRSRSERISEKKS